MPHNGPKKDAEKPSKAKAEAHRKEIAQAAEEACHLPGNINGPDLDDFEEKYHFNGFV